MKSLKIVLALLQIIILLLPCPSLALADSIPVIVDAKEIKDSGVAAGDLCSEEEGCITWETYFIYRAKVKRVLQGNLAVNDIIVAKGQHTGYVNKKINNWMILIQKIDVSEIAKKLGAQYIVKQSSFPEQYYCFDGKPDDVIDKRFLSRLSSSIDNYFCYSLDPLCQDSCRMN